MYICACEYNGPSSVRVFIKYVSSKIAARYQELTYRIYVTDLFRNLYANDDIERWYSLVKPATNREVFNADEIITDIIDRAGLVVE